MRSTQILLATVALFGCTKSSDPPDFPEDYAATYSEVRDCRGPSTPHQMQNIRVLVSPDAVAPYTNQTEPFPVGSVVLKEQYARNDLACAGDIVEYSVMVRLATGSKPDMLDWKWQAVDSDRTVFGDDIKTCTSCHNDCDGEGSGYFATCTKP